MRTLLAVALLVAAPLVAAPAPPVVNDAWLAAHLNDPNLVLLQVGQDTDYAAGHIPGAIPVSLKDISISDHTGKGLMLEMPPADDLRQRLEALGISDDSRVVVYYAKDWVSPATRVLYTLNYAGLGDRASLLDGGIPAWTAAGNKTTTEATTPKKGKLSALKIEPIVVDADFVKSHLNTPGYAVVDGRDAIYYDGTETASGHAGPHRTGHIAGAHSFPFTQLVDDQNRIRPTAELESLFEKAGVKPGDTVVGYCHIGQQATAMLLAARLTGHKVLLYDGSFEDWSRHDGYPVVNPSEKTK